MKLDMSPRIGFGVAPYPTPNAPANSGPQPKFDPNAPSTPAEQRDILRTLKDLVPNPSPTNIARWMGEPRRAFRGQKPAVLLKTKGGVQALRDWFGHVQSGMVKLND